MRNSPMQNAAYAAWNSFYKSGKAEDRTALSDNLPTGALVVIEADIDSWSDLGFQRGHLAHFMTPARLPSSD